MSSRRGFSLVELLVVVALMSLMLGCTLAAARAALDAVNRLAS